MGIPLFTHFKDGLDVVVSGELVLVSFVILGILL